MSDNFTDNFLANMRNDSDNSESLKTMPCIEIPHKGKFYIHTYLSDFKKDKTFHVPSGSVMLIHESIHDDFIKSRLDIPSKDIRFLGQSFNVVSISSLSSDEGMGLNITFRNNPESINGQSKLTGILDQYCSDIKSPLNRAIIECIRGIARARVVQVETTNENKSQTKMPIRLSFLDKEKINRKELLENIFKEFTNEPFRVNNDMPKDVYMTHLPLESLF